MKKEFPLPLRYFPLGIFVSLFLCCLLLTACQDARQNSRPERAVPVRLGQAVSQDVPRILVAVGNVAAYSSVQVKPQVGGQIIDVAVSVGQEVDKGDLLFRLDPRPFEAALAEAEARLAHDKALLAKNQQDLKRYASLLKQGAISQDAYEQIATEDKTLRATIAQDAAALQSARLNLEYAVIRAPVAGKLGDILVRLGNVVQANDARTLVVINSLRPAEVRFTVAERYLPAILQLMREGSFEVGVLPEGDTGSVIMGTVTAVNNEVDSSTGSIRLHALFENTDERLWPGQFVHISLVLAMVKDAIIVPERAVQEGISGKFVYLAVAEAEGGQYRVTPVTVQTEQGPEGYVVIDSGLVAGDSIITEGQLGLFPGALAKDMGSRAEDAQEATHPTDTGEALAR